MTKHEAVRQQLRVWLPLRNDPHNCAVIRAKVRVLIERLRATKSA